MNRLSLPSHLQYVVEPSTHLEQLRVLLIHAETDHSNRLEELLRTAGVIVEQSRLGMEANQALQTATFNILILQTRDCDEMSHYLHKWRTGGLKSPAIVVSETGSGSSIAADSGVVATISESMETNELRSRLNALIRLCRGESHVLEVFDLRIDPLLRKVERAGRSIDLTAREFGLLEVLATQPGKVISRRSILGQVFGISNYISSNLVDVYIRALRKKIDQEHSIKLIETRRGYGFLLRDEDEPAHPG